jgi:hypothetical protein
MECFGVLQDARERLELSKLQDGGPAASTTRDVVHVADAQITPDGHCMYHAIADQLATIGVIPAEQVSAARSARSVYLRFDKVGRYALPATRPEP